MVRAGRFVLTLAIDHWVYGSCLSFDLLPCQQEPFNVYFALGIASSSLLSISFNLCSIFLLHILLDCFTDQIWLH